jgi:hypothetical protein
MGIAEDLLALAGRLADPVPGELEQASFRRSISTAYYAVFHLLVQEAVQSWNGSPMARFGLERRFEHKTMKEVSNAVWRHSWRGWSTPPPAVPKELETVAQVFVKLQESRQQADYDNAQVWEPIEVYTKIGDAQFAFINWALVRGNPAANEYLLSLLIGGKRE